MHAWHASQDSRMLDLVDMAWRVISTDVLPPTEAEGGPPGAQNAASSKVDGNDRRNSEIHTRCAQQASS